MIPSRLAWAEERGPGESWAYAPAERAKIRKMTAEAFRKNSMILPKVRKARFILDLKRTWLGCSYSTQLRYFKNEKDTLRPYRYRIDRYEDAIKITLSVTPSVWDIGC
ncbi:MAG: hypothetical protein B7Z63_05415 [Ignavibacteriae bacterium 37-53-5]|nr:MAG: hypothetical protein B7Z63_05415 [Ignavibacteriae bacterium 37-53-5]